MDVVSSLRVHPRLASMMVVTSLIHSIIHPSLAATVIGARARWTIPK